MNAQHPPTRRSRRFLMQEFTSEEQVNRLAASEGWSKVLDSPAKRFGSEPRRISWEMAPGILFNYVSDRKLHTSYVVITSRESVDLDQYESVLHGSGLAVCTDASILESITEAETPEERGRALVRAGIGAPLLPDNRYSRAFINSVRDTSPDVRKNGLMGIGYAEWEPFRELLEAVAQQDPNAQVRGLAKRMATAFVEAGIGES
ncbi:hypothetical protein [Streptomyces noursei]|uniref:Uncharacterized protein n=1 Tax=Streptomyces noursei TaxID=1971 RepID=A0A401R688_STRNR|nr:hypothetical protein [Streptomyces noursei]UWS74023.1 hypothetical protein N1H47_23895 [Streptomyces noursei]GCB93135.1 hypothetical protein SALB_05914 [Streptomyces noursei]